MPHPALLGMVVMAAPKRLKLPSEPLHGVTSGSRFGANAMPPMNPGDEKSNSAVKGAGGGVVNGCAESDPHAIAIINAASGSAAGKGTEAPLCSQRVARKILMERHSSVEKDSLP